MSKRHVLPAGVALLVLVMSSVVACTDGETVGGVATGYGKQWPARGDLLDDTEFLRGALQEVERHEHDRGFEPRLLWAGLERPRDSTGAKLSDVKHAIFVVSDRDNAGGTRPGARLLLRRVSEEQLDEPTWDDNDDGVRFEGFEATDPAIRLPSVNRKSRLLLNKEVAGASDVVRSGRPRECAVKGGVATCGASVLTRLSWRDTRSPAYYSLAFGAPVDDWDEDEEQRLLSLAAGVYIYGASAAAGTTDKSGRLVLASYQRIIDVDDRLARLRLPDGRTGVMAEVRVTSFPDTDAGYVERTLAWVPTDGGPAVFGHLTKVATAAVGDDFGAYLPHLLKRPAIVTLGDDPRLVPATRELAHGDGVTLFAGEPPTAVVFHEDGEPTDAQVIEPVRP